MSQTPKSRSVRATKEGLEKVRQKMAQLEKPGKQDYKGWTQEDLAERSGVSLSTVKRFLKGEKVKRQFITWITEALGFQPTDIVAPLEWNPPEQTSSAIAWHEVCRTMLEPQRELASNLFTSGLGKRFEVDYIHVPLGLVERQQKPTRQDDFSPDEGSRVYQEEKITPIDYDDFFQKVLAQGQSPKSKGRRLSIIGEPGAGKTTQLLKIAEWVLAKTQDVPIWISLGAVGTKPLHQYLTEDWLLKAVRKLDAAPPEWVRELEQRLQDGRVWLLLDGADEMGDVDALGTLAQQLRVPLLKNLRVVLTVRLNLWDASGNALSDFDTYKMLDFSYRDSKNQDQVKQFIDKWFGSPLSPPEDRGETPLTSPFLKGVGGDLRTALDEKGKERIKDLVRNPLRLALLCLTWQSGQGKLPNTKAELYSVFVEALYELKKGAFPATSAQRRDLNAALGRLALKAIDTGAKSILPHRLVYEELEKPHPELFEDALKLGWLNRIGVDPQNPLKCVYAFFHPTFQEYFAATAIDNWHFFLNHAPHNPNIGTYRIFEPQWKEVMKQWLGRFDVEKEQKEAFIKALVEFEDECKDFYRYRAGFLAAAGIAEFGDCSYADEVVAQIVKWGFGYFDIKKQKWVKFSDLIKEAAKAALRETEEKRAIAALIELLHTTQDKYIRLQIVEILGYIGSGDLKAIQTLIKLAQTAGHQNIRMRAVVSLGQIGKDNLEAIQALIKLAKTAEDRFTRRLAERILGQIDRDKTVVVPTPIQLMQTTKSESTRRQAAGRLGQKGSDNPVDIQTLIELVQTAEDQFTLRQAVESLSQIGKDNPVAVQTLIELVQTAEDQSTRELAAASLGKIDPGNPVAIQTLIGLVQTAKSEFARGLAAYSLRQIIQGDGLRSAVSGLKNSLAEHAYDDSGRYEACYKVIWHCAQNMTYPAFYQAWHTQPADRG